MDASVISESLKYKMNINFGSYYFILPDDIPFESATYSDLLLVQAKSFGDIDIKQDYFPEGIKLTGQKIKYNEQRKPVPVTVTGTAVFASINGTNRVQTDNGVLIRHSYSTPKKSVRYEFLPIESVAGKYQLKYVFSVSRQVKVAITVSGDVLFDSEAEAEKFTHLLTFYGGEFSYEGIMIIVNEKCIHYTHYDTFINDAPAQITHDELFECLCKLCPTNKDQPYYEKAFRLEADWYEIVPIL
jgi:hypothetical protein